MESVDILIIGAGAVGLAIAHELSKTLPDVVVVEKEQGFGKHTSSRNSEVIHAGHYYETGSLKASLCVQGNRMLYDYLAQRSIPHQNTGKIIVATTSAEEQILHKYMKQGAINGCEGFRLLSSSEVARLEPRVKCASGLWIPSTGIFDTHKYMASLASETEARDAFIIYDMEVVAISHSGNSYIVKFTNGEVYQTRILINSAGLWADNIAALTGIDIVANNIRQHRCKGEYYKSSKIYGIKHLVYPVADPAGIFLGIHLTINLNGEVRFGPNAWYVDDVNYGFDDSHFEEFYRSIGRYIDIDREDLHPDDTGIRPKLQGPQDSFRDFYIREETDKGLPGLINLIGIESPGLTASLAIAKHVAELIS